MAYKRNTIVAQAKSWLGHRESNGSHKKIIDTYNAHTPRARGYKVKYTDEWCATFVSACSIVCGYTDILPVECSCEKMIALFKELGCWQEKDDYIPSPADVVFYDWQDTNAGDNTGYSDHVGIVEKVEGSVIVVIEGNYSNSVKRRNLAVNGKYIRGFGVPKYTEDGEVPVATAPKDEAEDYTLKEFIKDVQMATGSKVDGIAGPETLSNTVTLSAVLNRKHPLVYYVQRRLRALGYTEVGTIDGIAGGKFTTAVKHFQKDNDCVRDGEITARNKTWKKLLKME